MIELGLINSLRVVEKERDGFLLVCPDSGDEVLLPLSKITSEPKIGEMLDVFVYIEQDNLPVATMEKPIGVVGDFCLMTIVGSTNFGTFADMGLKKHLLIPKKLQKRELREGDSAVVYIGLDQQTEKLFGATKFSSFLEFNEIDLHRNQKVRLMPYEESSLGLSVVIDQKYQGMIYANEIFSQVEVGIEVTGFVKTVRPDGLVDVSLQPVGMTNVHHSRDIILEALKQEGGFLGLHDKSTPEAIKSRLGMSKQNFKRTVGILYKARIIDLVDNGLKLLKKST